MKKSFVIFLLFSVAIMAGWHVTPAHAKITVWEDSEHNRNFQLYGDVRFRLETQSDDSKSSPDSDNRVRERIRLRLGGVLHLGKKLEAGYRIATGSSTLDSPHQTLEGTDASGNANFGTDRAYIKYKHESGFWIWGGKNGLPTKQLTGQWMTTNIQPEGIALGYKTKFGSGSKLSINLARFIAQYNSYHAGNDYVLHYGLNYKSKAGIPFKVALLGFSVSEASRDSDDTLDEIPGGSAAYHLLGFEAKVIKPLAIGAEYYTSNVSESERGGAGEAKSGDTNGFVIYGKFKINKTFGIRVYHQDLGYASTPMLATWAGADFPYRTNYTGQRIRLDINTGYGMKIDLNYFTMSTKNKNLSSVDSGAMKGDKRVNRIQLNFNVGF